MNKNLHQAKKAKNDEFYTKLEDIEKELVNYDVSNFKDKVIYCNCDDYRWSNFVKCFKDNFEYLGIKKVMATNYDIGDGAWYYEYDGENEKVIELEGNGGYETDECIAFLKEADVVVTNPPFSLFRDYVKQLMDYNKKFLIIGNQNAITYKEIFPYIKNNQLWLGLTMNGSNRWFEVPPTYEAKENAAGYKVVDGKRMLFVNGVTWFTNIENPRRNTPLDLYKKYNEKDFPKYDNYDAINVDKVTDIPEDYDGVMGVPITFLYKYCPTQFEMLGHEHDVDGNGTSVNQFELNGKGVYKRLLIKKLS